MSKTLNLTDQLLSRGRFLQEIGRTHDAARLLGRLAGLRELPAAAAEETQARLAELNIRQRHFAQARRHLAAALTHNTKNARYHYLMAVAHDQDENGDPQTALDHFRQALRLDADQPRYLGDFGILALCLGHNEEGLAALRRGVEKIGKGDLNYHLEIKTGDDIEVLADACRVDRCRQNGAAALNAPGQEHLRRRFLEAPGDGDDEGVVEQSWL